MVKGSFVFHIMKARILGIVTMQNDIKVPIVLDVFQGQAKLGAVLTVREREEERRSLKIIL